MSTLSPSTRHARALLALPLLVLAGACDGTSETLEEPEMEAIVEFFARQTDVPPSEAEDPMTAPGALVLEEPPVDAAARAVQTAGLQFTFVRTVECPDGGTVQRSGHGQRTRDDEARQTSISWSVSAVHDFCKIPTPARTIAISSGGITGTGNVLWAWPDTTGGTPTLLEFSLTRSGTFGWRTEEVETGSCELSLVSEYTPAAGWITSGSICGRTIETTRAPLGWGS